MELMFKTPWLRNVFNGTQNPNLTFAFLSFEPVDSLRESDFRCTTSYLISTGSMTVQYHTQSI